MEDGLIDALEAELRAARADLDATTDWAQISTAWDRLHAAERALARERGEPYAVPVDIGVEWDGGAPLPQLLAGNRTFVVCRAREYDPDWDGTTAKVVSSGDPEASDLLVLEFERCAEVRMGGPNDEAMEGHPLIGRGLSFHYEVSEVFNSPWREQARRVNSVHEYHSDAAFDALRHFILAFHDEMVETLCHSIRVRRVHRSMQAALIDLAVELT
jgi:hypothetical protein